MQNYSGVRNARLLSVLNHLGQTLRMRLTVKMKWKERPEKRSVKPKWSCTDTSLLWIVQVTILAGAAVMDAALLLVAGNQPYP
jgi:translation initiation factor 2 gamma subunit (eIF-2gamma)